MTLADFTATLAHPVPPAGVHPVLVALWHDANGQWAAAHAIAQGAEGTPDYDRLHAYLHRKEGDNGNARHWYGRAHTAPFQGSLDVEWTELVTKQLGMRPERGGAL